MTETAVLPVTPSTQMKDIGIACCHRYCMYYSLNIKEIYSFQVIPFALIKGFYTLMESETHHNIILITFPKLTSTISKPFKFVYIYHKLLVKIHHTTTPDLWYV